MRKLTEEEANFHIKLGSGQTYRAVGYTLTACAEDGWEGWEDVTYYGESVFDASGAIRKPEWVYVLVNKSIPGICKIGMTTTTVKDRCDEINASSGVITPWFPVYSYKCANSRYLEREVHETLQKMGHRVNPRREGFEIPSSQAISVIEDLGYKYQTPNLPNHETNSL